MMLLSRDIQDLDSTQDQVSLIIRNATMKSCPLDPAPTSMVL